MIVPNLYFFSRALHNYFVYLIIIVLLSVFKTFLWSDKACFISKRFIIISLILSCYSRLHTPPPSSTHPPPPHKQLTRVKLQICVNNGKIPSEVEPQEPLKYRIKFIPTEPGMQQVDIHFNDHSLPCKTLLIFSLIDWLKILYKPSPPWAVVSGRWALALLPLVQIQI